MRKNRLYILVSVIACILACGLSANAQKRYVAGYAQNNDAVIDTIARAGGTVVANHSQISTIIVESDNPGFAAAVAADPNFSYVVEDQIVQWLPDVQTDETEMQQLDVIEPSFSPGPPGAAAFLSLQWNIFVTKTNQAWNVTTGSAAVKVAILDTGICGHHLDTGGKIDAAQSASFVPAGFECSPAAFPPCIGCPAWEDRHFHGTHVAATVSSNNHGTAGIAPNVRLRAVKVLNCTGSGAFSWVINGIIHAVNTGNDVINMSLGAYFPKNGGPGPGSLGLLVAALNKAVNFAETQGVLVVSAAGNSGIDLDQDSNFTAVPCQSGSGMCVGATTRSDALATFSNHGLSGPQIVAPGGGLPTAPFPPTVPNRFILAPCSRHSVLIPICGVGPFRWLFAAGTSMATPHVSGAAALADSVSAAGPGSRRGGQLRNALLKGADDLGKKGADGIYSHGRLNVLGAIQ